VFTVEKEEFLQCDQENKMTLRGEKILNLEEKN